MTTPICAEGCRFVRERPKTRLKSETQWESGIAILRYPGTSDVITIIDQNGKNVPYADLWAYVLDPYMGIVRTF